MVAADPPDGLVIDATGAAHLHGGEAAMVEGMVARLAASGIAGRAALADSWGAAHAFARFVARPTLVLPPGESATAVLDLPIAALRLPLDMVASLRVLGFERIAELAAQPRAPLALRFGPLLGRRLDQAMGHLAEPIDPIRPPDLIEVRRVFAEPIGAPETRPLHRQACNRALRGACGERIGSAASRSAVASRRQPDRSDPRRNGNAGTRRETSDAAAL